MTKDVLAKALKGEPIQFDDPGFQAVDDLVARNSHILAELNTNYHQHDDVIALLPSPPANFYLFSYLNNIYTHLSIFTQNTNLLYFLN